MRSDVIERGKKEAAAWEAEYELRRQENIRAGQSDVLRSFVFRFYHDTMVNTHLSGAFHDYGAESPQPEVKPLGDPGGFGGGYHNIVWEIDYDNIRWRAKYSYRMEAWGLDFYVLGRTQVSAWKWRHRLVQRIRRAFGGREWVGVHSPASVAAAMS